MLREVELSGRVEGVELAGSGPPLKVTQEPTSTVTVMAEKLERVEKYLTTLKPPGRRRPRSRHYKTTLGQRMKWKRE